MSDGKRSCLVSLDKVNQRQSDRADKPHQHNDRAGGDQLRRSQNSCAGAENGADMVAHLGLDCVDRSLGKGEDARIEKQNKQDEDIKSMKSELCLLTYGLLACLKGLKEQGCNGPVTEAIEKIEKRINKQAHEQDE